MSKSEKNILLYFQIKNICIEILTTPTQMMKMTILLKNTIINYFLPRSLSHSVNFVLSN